MGQKGIRMAKGKRQGTVHSRLTPSKAQKQVPQLLHALKTKDKEVEALRNDRSKTHEALKALKQKSEDAQARESQLQRENAELAQKLQQAEEAVAEQEKALQAERTKYAQTMMPRGQREALLADLREMARENKEGWERERERFSNYKARTERQREDAHQQGTLDTLKALLSTIDDLERATDSLPPDIRENNWGEGVGLIHRKLVFLLEKYNVEAIDPAPGDLYDANFHESTVAEENAEYESDQVIETIQKGYCVGDRLLRAALVKVAR